MAQHITIYRVPGRYAGWPANYGIWSWNDEILVGFTVGYHQHEGGFHSRDRSRPFVAWQARSLNGGHRWQTEVTPCQTPGNRGLSADEHVRPDLGLGQTLTSPDDLPVCPAQIDFSRPGFALMCARSGLRAGAISWFYLSTDRGRTWLGPYRLPMFDQKGIAARTDYLVEGPQTCLLFLTATKPDGEEGRVFCARTTNGGRTFAFISWIGPEYAGFSIMPASLRLPSGRLVAVLRCRGGQRDQGREKNWLDLYYSDDDGHSWHFLNQPVANTGIGGNPPALTRLQDGRLCLTYGFRDRPSGLRAKLSADDGVTWSDERILRDDGGNHDLGYPRSVQRSDGKMVTIYYFNDHPYGERYLAATIWSPD